jgi:ankyrin repeat protein
MNFLSFLQDEPTLPRQLEELNLTRLCFSYLSLDSHDSDVTKGMIHERALRGEYAFTEYAVIHMFDHLLSVVSGTEAAATLEYRSLGDTLRTFIAKRVNASKNRAVIPNSIERILQVFKSEDFFHSLKHAIAYHKSSREEATENEDEAPVLALLAHLARVRSVMENMITFSNLGTSLKPIYGPNLFKCSEPQCESFHQGFPTKGVRDNHRDTHTRVFFCSSSGCQSSMIGFSTAVILKKHEQDYHQELFDKDIFPWYGTLEKLNIHEEVKKGNYAAFELWSSQWENLIPFKEIKASGNMDLMCVACCSGLERVVMELLHRVDWGEQEREEAEEKKKFSRRKEVLGRKEVQGVKCLQLAMNSHQEELTKALIRHFSTWQDTILYRRLGQALNTGWDAISLELLAHPSSPILETSTIRKARRASYLNLAIKHGRDAIVRHILDTNNVDPEQQDDKGRTSLVAAAEFDRIEIALYLIKTKNCSKWTGTKLGVTPLSMAGRQGHERFIASIFPEEPSTVDVQMWLKAAQLRNATRDGNEGKVKELFHDNLVRPDEVDMQHKSPWLWAVKGGHSRIVELFLSRPDIVFQRQFRSAYPRSNYPGVLHIAALSGNDLLMQLLLQSGKFDSELDRSSSYFAKCLSSSRKPLDIAKSFNHIGTVKVIEDHMASLKQEHEKR